MRKGKNLEERAEVFLTHWPLTNLLEKIHLPLQACKSERERGSREGSMKKHPISIYSKNPRRAGGV